MKKNLFSFFDLVFASFALLFDLKDFFPNIKFWDVQNLFLRMNLSQKISEHRRVF